MPYRLNCLTPFLFTSLSLSKCFIALLRCLQILKITQPGAQQPWPSGGQEGGLSVKGSRAKARLLVAWSSALHFCHPSKAEGRAVILLPPLLLGSPPPRGHLSSPPSLLETQPVQNPSSCLSHPLPSSSGLWMSELHPFWL